MLWQEQLAEHVGHSEDIEDIRDDSLVGEMLQSLGHWKKLDTFKNNMMSKNQEELEQCKYVQFCAIVVPYST